MKMNGKYSLFLCTGLFLLAGCNMGRELHNEPAPLIVFDVADGLYSVKTGKTLTITPQVSYDAGASYTWELDGSIVGTDKQYVFSAQLPGTYLLTLRVSRPDITVSKQVRIDVLKTAAPHIFLAVPEYGYSVLTSASLEIRPIIDNKENATFLWKVDQVEVSRDSVYAFTSSREGVYDVFFCVVNEDGTDQIFFKVKVSDTLPPSGDTDTTQDPAPPSGKYYRASHRESSAHWSVVLEYTPAPGQFINEQETGGFSGENTPEKAILYAEKRLKQGLFISLGAFGADDTWYELKGSEHDNSRTIRNYAVTYFRPRETGRPVYWADNEGNTGTIDYLGPFHGQDSYYPLWIDRDYYTLTGTRLESRNYLSQSGSWISPAYGWGYADNHDQGLFRISDAVKRNGNPIHLDFIDFVKVQTGVNGKSGWLGEISTEICSICDYNLIK